MLSISLEHVLDEAVKEMVWAVDRALCFGDAMPISWNPDGLAESLHEPETRVLARDILKLAGTLARRQIVECITSRTHLLEALELATRFEQSTRAALAGREAAADEFAREFESRISL